MSLEATDIERRLRANRDAFVLKQHVSGKSEAWKHFSLIFENRSKDSDLVELKYTCAYVMTVFAFIFTRRQMEQATGRRT